MHSLFRRGVRFYGVSEKKLDDLIIDNYKLILGVSVAGWSALSANFYYQGDKPDVAALKASGYVTTCYVVLYTACKIAAIMRDFYNNTCKYELSPEMIAHLIEHCELSPEMIAHLIEHCELSPETKVRIIREVEAQQHNHNNNHNIVQ